ncbi:GNAT family N-acetyltransferase [Gordonia soli]|uniref:Putative acetyltransferase n=1 Tax=Gordonia soli NBRC 108243 TaxID=1223545 RepID=M0QMY3_9ACTN|nr:GNAT family N-acetyltransferase [Gordonia soli]GAC69918.1 putative acetyltransferase [Gordonia soli NBRC 108243]
MPEITVVRSRDIEVASAVLAQAFADDPVVRWMAPDPRRHRLMFRTLLRYAHGRADGLDLAVRDGQFVGAAVWDPPGHKESATRQMLAMGGFVRSLGSRIGYGAAVEQLFAKARPPGTFWYLAQVGAPAQGLGIGSALLRARLETIEGPAYLESSNVANIPLYERFGFEVTDEISLPHDGPLVWPMYRRG